MFGEGKYKKGKESRIRTQSGDGSTRGRLAGE